jgi:hypothetical protein
MGGLYKSTIHHNQCYIRRSKRFFFFTIKEKLGGDDSRVKVFSDSVIIWLKELINVCFFFFKLLTPLLELREK